MKSKILVIAHRGYSGKYPENTMPAFYASIENSADMIELDVHFTKDEQLIVTHDFKLGRCIKRKGRIIDYSCEAIKQLDSGKWFSSEFEGITPPLLIDVLDFCANKILINIEIKKETIKGKKRKVRMAKKLIASIDQSEIKKDNIVVSSFDHRFLEVLREEDQDIKIGILNNSPHFGLKRELIKKLNSYSYHPNFKRLSKRAVDKLHKYNQKVFPYTANKAEDFRKLSELNVDGIITNQVTDLQRFLDEL